MSLQITLCGLPQVSFEGKPLPFRVSGTAWALLAMLVTSERPIPRESLANTLWPNYERVDALANLRRHLHIIAKALPPTAEPWIRGDKSAVGWNHAAQAVVDVVRFEALLEQGSDRDAVEVYRGDLLPQSFEDNIVARREHLRSAYLNALERLIDESLSSREFARVLDYAERLLATDEWRESAVCAWMTAKYESGDGSAALAMYGRTVRRLKEEFGVEPAPSTTALRDQISAGLPLPRREKYASHHFVEPEGRRWEAAFVGRTEPLDRLVALWSRTVRGSGGVAFISGEAGIGKSRLAREFAGRIRDRGGRVVLGTTSNPESEPYESVVTAVRSCLDSSIVGLGDRWLAILAHVIPELHSMREGLEAPQDTSIDGARERLFQAVARALEHLGRKQPLCLILEDLHWAGPATADLLASLARRVGTLPVAILVTYRVDASAPLAATGALRARLVSERRAIDCPLAGLDADETSTLVDTSAGGAGTALRDSIASLSEGNPLFIAQLVANFLETGEHPHAAATPGGVGDAIAARLRRLDHAVRAVAETAAVIGESFRVEVLSAAGGWDEAAVLNALESLMDRGIVREAGGALEYTFAHALFAATLYSESSSGQRTARHRRIATVLERDLGDDAASAGTVARHWKLAGEPVRAAHLYLRAAESALRLYARGDAIAFAREIPAIVNDPIDCFAAYLLISRTQLGYGDVAHWKADIDALAEIASAMESEQRFAALEQAEAYYHQIGDRPNQRRTIDAMMELTAHELTPRQRIASLFALGKHHAAQSQLPQALERLQEALAIAIESEADDDAFAIRERLAHTYGRLGRYTEGLAEIAALREVMREKPSSQKEILILRSELTIANSRQRASDSRRVGERLATVARETGDLEGEVMANMALAWAAQFDSDVPSVRAQYEAALDSAERLGFAKGIVSVLMDRGSFEHRIGNAPGTVAFYDRALEKAREVGAPTTIAYSLVNRASAETVDGDVAAALALAREALEMTLPAERRLLAAGESALATAMLADGDPAGCLEHLATAIPIRRELGDTFGLAEDLCTRVEALDALQRDDETPPLLQEIAALYEENPKLCEYPVRTCSILSAGARKSGDEGKARAYLKRALELLARELARAPDEAAKQTLERRRFNRAVRELQAHR